MSNGSNSGNSLSGRRGNIRRHRSPLNSGLNCLHGFCIIHVIGCVAIFIRVIIIITTSASKIYLNVVQLLEMVLHGPVKRSKGKLDMQIGGRV
ncbi:hypothetical protein L6164_013557 [Bauhinia variegata]|uniref:Uncharacterized protein n=1 Tax=Bauhinia variegata TaxID=167791 RepID=A0ACB9NFQ6_BAUVA|nr:hypothetical protein L6164_013557 [Bauhinia variegata]